MLKGLHLHSLLQSKVFDWTFDFDNWPGNHNDDKECIRAFNGSFFDIRENYTKIFPDFNPLDYDHGEIDKQKIFKIKYSINLLAQIDMHIVESEDSKQQINSDVSLMSLAGESDELCIFETDSLN